jgi:hypothetical protein
MQGKDDFDRFRINSSSKRKEYGSRLSGKSSARKDYQRRKKEVLTSSDFILCGAAVILILKWKQQVVRQASIDVLSQTSFADAPSFYRPYEV